MFSRLNNILRKVRVSVVSHNNTYRYSIDVHSAAVSCEVLIVALYGILLSWMKTDSKI